MADNLASPVKLTDRHEADATMLDIFKVARLVWHCLRILEELIKQ